MKISSRDQFIENKVPFKLPSTSRNYDRRQSKVEELCKKEEDAVVHTQRKTNSRASSVTTYESILKNKQNVMK